MSPTALIQEEGISSKVSSTDSGGNKSSKMSKMKKKLNIFKSKRTSTRKSSINDQSESESEYNGNGGGIRTNSLMSDDVDEVLRVDKYGSIIEEDLNNKSSNTIGTAQIAVDSSSTMKDMKMMKRIARNGLPDPTMRHRAWAIITGVDRIVLNREGEYDALVGKSRVDMKQIQECLMGGQHRTAWGHIERDLRRTFPNHYLFQENVHHDNETASGTGTARSAGGVSRDLTDEGFRGLSTMASKGEGYGKKALRRILRAYSVYDSEVGYCQGMNFIAAMFLTFLPEEESFWMLVVVMNEDPFKLRDLFTQELTGTHEVLYIADSLISKFLPELYEKLENEQIHVSHFITQWLMTLFTSTFPFQLVARVWDSFLCDGWIVVYRTMLALLDSIQQELMKKDMDQILSYLRTFPPLVNGDKIIASSSKIALQQHHIQAPAAEFRALVQNGEIRVEEVLHSRVAGKDAKSIDGYSNLSKSSRGRNVNNVYRFVSKLKHSTREITFEDLSPKLAPVVGLSKFAVLLYNVLSTEECDGLIKRAKGEQFEDVLMRRSNGDGGGMKEIASCRRSMIEDLDLASELFDRLAVALQGTEVGDKLNRAPWVDPTLVSTGLNDRLHFLGYGQGQFFAPHRDTRFKRGTEVSHITMQVYLNNNFTGGYTSFRGGKRFLDVKPKMGSVLLFDQDLRREECEVLAGRKFIVRSDVMFEKTP